MFVQGAMNPEHLIRLFLAKEYAFSITYSSGIELRIAHHKGLWYVARFSEKKCVDSFTLGDDYYLESPFPLTYAMVEGLVRMKIEQSKVPHDGTYTREFPSFVLSCVFGIFGGLPDKVEKIEVVQPGRNATIDENGEFQLAPRPEDFKK